MKSMSDVFNLPVQRFSGDSMEDCKGEYVGDFWTDSYAEHAAHAINLHDELVEALQELFNSVGGGDKSCGHEFSCICAVEKTRNALKKARGEI